MNRILLTLLLVSNGLFAQKAAPVGIELYSFRKQFANDMAGTMAKVQQMGFREVEVAGIDSLDAPELRKLLDKNGLKAISLGATFDDLDSNVPKVLAQAKALGAKYVVCFWIPHSGDAFTIYDADRAVDVLSTAGSLLAQNGVSLCYHPHGYEFQTYKDGTFMDYLAENLDAKSVNFEMDVYWVKSPGYSPVALLQKYIRSVSHSCT